MSNDTFSKSYKLKQLRTIREELENYLGADELCLFTYNKNTGETGVATFYKNQKKIKVFEGNGDGSDDKEMNYTEFVTNYKFILAKEYCRPFEKFKI